MITLVLGPIPSDISPENLHILSPYSFIGKEKTHPNWHQHSYTHPDFNPSTFSQFSAYYLNEELLPKLCTHLNKIHQTNHTPLFWRMILMPFLVEFWGLFSTCSLTLCTALDTLGNTPVNTEILSKENKWVFNDMTDFGKKGLMNPTFIYWILSRLTHSFRIQTWTTHDIPYEVPTHPPRKTAKPDSRSRRAHLIPGFSTAQLTFLSLLLTIKTKLKPTKMRPRPIKITANPNTPISENLQINTHFKTHCMPEFEELVLQLLPLAYTTHFQTFQKKAETLTYLPNALRLISTAFCAKEQIKYYMANAIESGEIIIGAQHGGSYGIDRIHLTSQECEINHKLFISWGWQSQNNTSQNIIPLASPLCSKYAEKHQKKNSDIVLVSTHIWPLGLNALFSEFIGSDWTNYVKTKCQFIASLTPETLTKFKYRPHPHALGSLSDIPVISQEFPSLSLSKGSFENVLLQASLLVLDHTSTTLNLAVAANTPFIILLPNAITFCPEAATLFQEFEKVGILYRSPTDAAEKINTCPNIQAWWQSTEVQAARKTWMHTYARTHKTPFLEWTKALWNL